jgi:hypothetical protein
VKQGQQVKEGQQTIQCDVSSCKFFDRANLCTLDSIKVAPCKHVNNGVPEDETLCSSYKCK